ncbi:MAG: ribonuclease HII [Clostridiales bacterium]|nr:ribonuclease HII [Clostridiales bacterium]
MRVTKKSVEEYAKTLSIDDAIEYIKKSGLNNDALINKYLRKKAAYEKEVLRYNTMCQFENKLFDEEKILMIAGVDEAGRGPLAGPVVAGAVILNRGEFIEGINDSKKLSEKKREELFDKIMSRAVAVGVGIVDHKCIDDINILMATKLAMKKALDNLKVKPQYALIDAVTLDNISLRHAAIVKGDEKSVSIAAASIIAKVTRDRLMIEMDGKYPQYGFAKHKGYGTKEHIDAIKKFGASPIHRMTFIQKFLSNI